MNILLGILLGLPTGFVVFILIRWYALRTAYGFTPIDWFRGWRFIDAGSLYYVLPRFTIRSPIPIYWYSSTESQHESLALAMRKYKKDFNLRAIRYNIVGYEAIAALYRGEAVWPSQEIAIACGDPDGWWPGKG